jgi:hypothetical protein
MAAVFLPTIYPQQNGRSHPNFFNIPQTATTWRRLPSGYSIWQNGRFQPKPLTIPNAINKQTSLLQPKRCALLQNFTAQTDSVSPSSR